MPFNNLSGATARAAADHVDDWFAVFEVWISAVVGWTIEAGAGTDDLRLSSVGEGGTYTMLFVHIWRVPGTDQIRGEVSDDVIPTHETTEAGYVDGDGVQFQYWMSADLDAICIIVPYRATHRALYVGIVAPLAITPADETYHMVASAADLQSASILRNHTGVWDVDIANFGLSSGDNQRRSLQDQTFCPTPLLANRLNEIAGQYKFVSGLIDDTGVSIGDEMTSNVGGTSVWKAFFTSPEKIVMQISGVTPVDEAPGPSFATMTAGGIANSANLIATLGAWLAGVGWTVTDPGAPGNSRRLFYSQGEDGTHEIYCLLCEGIFLPQYLNPYVQNDAVGTIRTPQMDVSMQIADFPLNIWAAADLNGIAICVERPGIQEKFLYMGLPHMATPDIGDIYNLVSWARPVVNSYVLRSRRPANPNPAVILSTDNNLELGNSNANAFDPNTYCLWPSDITTAGEGLGVPQDPIGPLRFIHYTNGGGIARLDTITVGAAVHTIFDTTGGGAFLSLRTT